MKFVKTKAVAALSIVLLLSTQAKGMGHDTEAVLQTPMAQLPVEVVNPSLSEQARQMFSTAKNFTVDSSKSLYGAALDNKALTAGVVGLGAAGVARKKYPKTALATGVISSAVIAADLTGKYSPATLEKGKEVVANAANSVSTLAQGAGNYMLEAGKTAANFVAANSIEAGKFVAAHTPEFVKNVPSYVEGYEVPAIMAAGLVGYGAYKAATPVKNAVKKAAEAARPHAKKIAVGAAATGAVAAAVYYNQDAIANFAKEAVSAVNNHAVKPAGQFAANQYGKLKVNGARLVEAARNMDVKAMAKNTGEFMKNHKLAVGGSAIVLGTAGYITKQVIDERRENKQYEDSKKAASVKPVKMTDLGDELRKASLLKPALISPREMSARAVSKPAPAQPKRIVEQTILPGQDAA